MLSLIGFYAVMAGVFTFGKQVVLYVEPFFIFSVTVAFGGGLILYFMNTFYNRKQCYISKIAPF